MTSTLEGPRVLRRLDTVRMDTHPRTLVTHEHRRNDKVRTHTRTLLGGIALLTIAGCGGASGAANAAPGNSAPTTAPNAASGATVTTSAVNGHGTVLVAASNGMTLYQFSMDIAGSGTSACTSACLTRWPALTVPAGSSPSATSGITGQFGTIIRTDGGGTQVIYNGRPLHFFSGDSQAGDANGNYPNWSVVAVTAAAASGSSGGGGTTAPTATPTSGY